MTQKTEYYYLEQKHSRCLSCEFKTLFFGPVSIKNFLWLSILYKYEIVCITFPPVSAGSCAAECRRPDAARCVRWRRAPPPPHFPPLRLLIQSTCTPRVQSCPAFSSYTYLYDPSAVFAPAFLLVDLCVRNIHAHIA